MLLNQLSRALYEIRSTQKTNIYIYTYILKLDQMEEFWKKIFLLVLLLSGAFILWIHWFLETTFLSLFNFFSSLRKKMYVGSGKAYKSALLCAPNGPNPANTNGPNPLLLL